MIATLGIVLFGMFLMDWTSPPDLAGRWSGEGWGHVVLTQSGPGQYSGTYSDTAGKGPGKIELKWSRIERRFNGTWSEGEDRFGELSIRLVDHAIRGALTTDPKSKVNPATPRLADLLWARMETPPNAVEGVPRVHLEGWSPVQAAPRATRPRHFVRLVIGKNKMTLQGWETDAARLPGLLERVADRPHTVLQVGTTAEGVDKKQRDAAFALASGYVKALGFEYLSDVGVQPLRAKGDATQRIAQYKLLQNVAAPSTGGAPSGRPVSVADALEEYRRTIVGYHLGFDSVFPRQKWTRYDDARLGMYPTKDAWPPVLGHVDTNPEAFRVLSGEPTYPSNPVAGPNAFMLPLGRDLVADSNYVTLLFLKGIAPKGTVVAKTYASLVCFGPMEGRLNFGSYATALVKGDLSGQITSDSYFNLVVTGKFSGRLYARSYAMIYLLGGCEGIVELKDAKLYIAGRTTQAALSRVNGPGKVFLEASDLAAGEHQIGDFTVTVGASR